MYASSSRRVVYLRKQLRNSMEMPHNLVYYASVAKGTRILAQYLDDGRELADAVAESLARLPPLHSRYTFAANDRIVCYLMEGCLTYCTVVDEKFGKQQAFALLEHIRNEFKKLLAFRGLQDRDELEGCSLDREFLPVMRNILAVAAAKENDMIQSPKSFDDDVPLMSKARLERRQSTDSAQSPFQPLARAKSTKLDRKKSKEQVHELREIMVERMEQGDGDSDPSGSSCKIGSMKAKSPQLSQRIWWRSVKVILIIDLILCIVLVTVWLAVCKGFQCF